MPGPDLKGALIKAHTLDVAIGPALVVMKGVGDNTVKFPTGTGVEPRGVTIDGGALGDTVPIVMNGGICYVTAAGAIAVDARVYANGTAGKIDDTAPAQGTNQFSLGKAMEAAAADGDQIKVMIDIQVVQGP